MYRILVNMCAYNFTCIHTCINCIYGHDYTHIPKQRRQSGLKTSRYGFENVGAPGIVCPKGSIYGDTKHRIEGIFSGIIFNYTQIILLMKSHHFRKCSHLIFLHMTPTTRQSQNLGCRDNPNRTGLASMYG